ncbi:nucleoside triphosphate pyrophosphohydrolase family protein [Paracoccus sp. 08]|uniref:nucleoside triphosphate pyrophosphohydrolase family protein n=1 Tax=Paracoccus sp. 08 TaxID=2606624 RepID=UPI0020952481|nr:nucleoside triphosphate pyrophosphohydrolase family protein [Paracoccus sp. 08]MCO6364377.1 pyrophosphatase [Paracoccus sp. 08]
MADEFVPLSVQQFSREAIRTDRRSDDGSLNFPLLGLFGEVGSLLAEVKKKQRDKIAYLAYAEAVTEELGDVLWYFNLVAIRGGVTFADIVTNLHQDGDDWESASEEALTFDALQPSIIGPPKSPTEAFENTLIELAAAVGRLMDKHAKNDLSHDPSGLGPSLASILETLIRSANEAGVSLEAAAVKNRHKTLDRWPVEKNYPCPFDEDAPFEEQLPRHIKIEIFERSVSGKNYVFQTCHGLNIGDRLTDNAMTPDDYRFHDVFHYAYVAVLGWSPVTRSLFRLKRKSQPTIDEAQDGARAKLIEEGVTTWIFGQAMNMEFFEGRVPGELPFDLLKQVRQFVSGYEVSECPAWLWERAILQGYAAFRYLREHRRGTIVIDMVNRRLDIE